MTAAAVSQLQAAAAPVGQGLSAAQVRQRQSERARSPKATTSRSYSSIVRANVFTIFNLILATAGTVTLIYGQWQDALFLGLLVANSAIGITQEVRAKRALDRLAALVAPTATVIRDGNAQAVAVDEVVAGDLVRVGGGDQVVADGTLLSADLLRLDESILTGESRSVRRGVGDGVRSGSFVAEGSGAYTVTAVGEESYAAKITGEARKFRHSRSPLEQALNRLLIVLVCVLVPLGLILGAALWQRHTRISAAVPTSVAAVVTLIPEGLILLVSLTYAVASLGIARRGALAQQLNAIESLASVDLICLDKTGTLTETRSRVAGLLPAAGVTEKSLADVLGRYAASSHSRNGTIEALAEAYPEAPVPVLAELPFSSRWRFSGLEFGDGAYAVGAPELFALGDLAEPAEREARRGRRVLAVLRIPDGLDGIDPEEGPPPDGEPLGLILLAEALRGDARETVAFFLSQGVDLKVLSGDRPETVAAIASDVGLPRRGPPLDGTSLPEDDAELAAALARSSVVGRISPEGKQRVVRTLTRAGHYVAMVGDGVNDVPALKAARLAIAPGTGTQMARAVADLVLVSGSFAAVPSMVEQGRRILRNLQRVAKLFVTKSAFAAFLVLSIGLMPTAYPLLPRHLTLAASLTIGIPAFFLALAPSKGSFQTKGFLREVGEFAVPAGTAAGFAVLSSYLFGLNVLHLGVAQSRTLATTTLILVGLAYIVMLEATGRRRGRMVGALCVLLLAIYGLVLAAPVGRRFFALTVPLPQTIAVAVFGAAWAIAGLAVTGERFRLGRRGPDGIAEPAAT